MDRAKRTELLHKIQQLVHDKAIYVPLWQLAFISAVGPRVDQSGLGLIKGYVYPAPYEELTVKART
jgi:peptide/nickel transport system substrate-binding protein